MSVAALTCQLEVQENGEANIRTEPPRKGVPPPSVTPQNKQEAPQRSEEVQEQDVVVPEPVEEVTRSIDQVLLDDGKAVEENAAEPTESSSTPNDSSSAAPESSSAQADGQVDEESDGGEWITPSNVKQHRSHDLGLLPTGPDSDESGPIAAACMTGDFAVQNVLLSMGLGLVGEGGKLISKVKSFVLRCHACFK